MKRMLTKKLMAERYSVTLRTIERWREDEILPQPTIINGRWYFDEVEIEKHERDRMVAAHQPASTDA